MLSIEAEIDPDYFTPLHRNLFSAALDAALDGQSGMAITELPHPRQLLAHAKVVSCTITVEEAE